MKNSLAGAFAITALTLIFSACGGESAAALHNSAGVEAAEDTNWEQAKAELDQAILLDPEFALAYYNRGQAYFALEQFGLAIRDYGEAIRLQPELVLFQVKRGEAYYALGEYELAIQEFDEAISREPDFAMAYYDRGGAYLKLDQRDQAIQDYKNALRNDRRFERPSGFRCRLFDDLYQYQPAFRHLSSGDDGRRRGR